MKKNLLLLAAAIGFATASYAQTSYGVKAGVTFPKMTISGGSVSYTSDAATGFYLTGYADVPVANNFSFQPGISLQNKGGKFTSDEYIDFDTDAASGTVNLMYIEVPLNFVYYIPAGTGNLFLGAGPYAAYGVSVKAKSGNMSESGSFDEMDLNAFDAGVNFLGGYKLSNGFLINAGYGLGLANMLKDSDGEGSMKNKVFSVGIGFQF